MSPLLSIATAPILALVLSAAEAATLTGRVVDIHDGASITVLDATNTQHRIHLYGIDAPKLNQAFGGKSKQNLSYLVYDKEVKVEWDKRDRHKRIVGKVWVVSPNTPCRAAECPKTLDAGLAQLTVGLAWYDKEYEHEQSAQDRGRYSFAEYEAKAKHAGLWADPNPTPHWEWRRGGSPQ